jgi:hypothetical protein
LYWTEHYITHLYKYIAGWTLLKCNYKLNPFGQQIRNTWNVLKCGAGEGWRRLVG